MKKTLKEQLQRIHRLNYGNQVMNEGFLDSLLGRKDEKKADVVEPDVQKFFDTLQTASESNGISQQERGSMTFQKEVETMQIGLILLGYELPRFGVDGLFGPETASAVSEFTSEKVSGDTKTSISEAFVRLGDTNYSHVKFDRDGTQNDQLNQALLDDLQTAASNANVVVTITTAKSGHGSLTINGKPSRHATNTAVDIALLNGIGAGGASNGSNGNPEFRELGNRVQKELLNMGYALNAEGGNQRAVLWQTNTGGNHFNHLHVSNKEGVSGSDLPSETMTKATPEMLKKLLELLKERGVKSSEIQQYTNVSDLNYTGSTDNEFYTTLLQVLQAPVTQENMKFLLAWRQAEGRGGINNPFNTTWNLPGSTTMNDAGVRNYSSPREGLVATVKTLKNGRYDCILLGLKNDIGADRIAQCESLKTWGTGDLVAKVLRSYNAGAKPRIASLS